MKNERQDQLINLLESFLPEEGIIRSTVKSVDLFRISRSSPRAPELYVPNIIILAQGRKRVFMGDEIFIYDPLNYLVISVPLALECETDATPNEPMLGLAINVDPSLVGEILLEADNTGKQSSSLPKGIFSSSLSDDLMDAVIRLLDSMSSSQDSRFLGPMIVREIIYRILCGDKGEALRALAYRNQRFFQIARVLNRIHGSYGEDLDLRSLARETGMSISTFHASFKAVTNSSPLKYIKNIRLHKARLLMKQEGYNAYSAALHVGYESPSQFNREYKRLFGITPGKDSAVL